MRSKPTARRTLGPPCPRCKAQETQRERNFGKEIKDGRWWCPVCRHLWWLAGSLLRQSLT